MTEAITIRLSTPADAEALRRLAELDAGHAPAGPALLAYVDDELVAAVGLEDGQSLADPFRETLDVVKMLGLRAAQERGSAFNRVAAFPSLPRERTRGSFAPARPRGAR